jgi:hypothetical protein
MGRHVPVEKSPRGSQKWLWSLINAHSDLVNNLLIDRLNLQRGGSVSWISPLSTDDFAEYSDNDFLERLGISLARCSLREFWPGGGPHWDALGKSEAGEVFLIEAKAHVKEMLSPGTQASPHSRDLIRERLHEVKHFLNVGNSDDWTQALYQYANRLAHLYFLREKNGIPAFLVFIYFLGDHEMGGPATKEEWLHAIKLEKGILGLPAKHRLDDYIIDLFIDVDALR